MILILLIILKYIEKSYEFSNNNSDSELNSFPEKNFSHLLPRITLNNYKDNVDDDNNLEEGIPSLKDVFYSREIYINNNNLTNEYIRFVRPINEEEEKIYKTVLYPDLQFNELYNTIREDQYDFISFYKLCTNHTL